MKLHEDWALGGNPSQEPLLSQIDLIHAEAAKKNKASIASLKKAGFIEGS